MIALIPILSILLGMAYSAMEGKREGPLFYLKMKFVPIGSNDEILIGGSKVLHSRFTWQRLIFYISLSAGLSLVFPLWKCAISLPLHGIMFPFIHDGYYYMERHRLQTNLYPEGFDSQSTTSEAESDKKWWSPFNTFNKRLICFIIGAAGIITLMFIK